MKDGEKSSPCRYIALDIHKHYSVVAGVDRDGQEILPPCRVEHEDWRAGWENICCPATGW